MTTIADRSRASASCASAGSTRAVLGRIHRLRDLPSAGRLAALALGLLLLVAPVSSAVRQADRWFPQGDNAFIAMRAHDVGTTATPLVGQPSTSHEYDDRGNVDHPGPFEFYLLAPLVRIFDDKTAMLVLATAITAVSLLTTAWAVFRRWGSPGGLLAVVGLAVLMWSKGAAALVQPISSNIGWLPLVCTTVLVWGLLCRDWRLLPAAVVFGSFTAQQHLAVLPAVLVVVAWGAVAVALALVAWRRRGSPQRGDQELARFARWALALGVVSWLPVVVNTFVDFPGNTLRIARFAVEGGGGTSYGPSGGLRQVLNALGLPPLITRTEIGGDWLVRPVDPFTVLTALVIAGTLAAIAIAWRRSEPTFARLVVMGGGVALGGFVNGMSQPDAPSANRISYYHWAFALGFLELLAFGWVAWTLARRWWSHERPVPDWVRVAAVPLAALLVVVPSVAVVTADRTDRDLPNFVDPATIHALVDLAEEHRAELGSSFVVFRVGIEGHLQIGDSVIQYLQKAGMPATFSRGSYGFVDEVHMMDPCTNQRALLLGMGVDRPRPLTGRPIGVVPLYPGFDLDAFARLTAQAKGQPVVLGPALEARLAEEPPATRENATSALTATLGRAPGTALRNRGLLAILAEAPPESPALDRADLQALLRSFPEDVDALSTTSVSASILDRDQIRERWPKYALDC